MPLNTDLIIRYDFYEKQTLHLTSSLSEQEDTTSEVRCNLAYFTQELAIVDTRVLKKRIIAHMAEPNPFKYQLSDCMTEFDKLNADNVDLQRWSDTKVEEGFSCDERTYYYKVTDTVVAEKKFVVRGVKNRAIT